MNRICLALALALVVSVACADDDSAGGGEAGSERDDDQNDGQDADLMAGPAEWEVVDEPPAEPPRFTAQPVWESRSPGTATGLVGATLHGDSAVVVTQETETIRLDVVDLTTGEPRWGLASPGRDRFADADPDMRWSAWSAVLDQGRPVVVEGAEPGGGWAVLVQYQEHLQPADDYRPGVAALSGETGELLWERVTEPQLGARDAHLVYDMVGNRDAAVMVSSPDPSESWQMTGLDPVDGSILWERCCIPGSVDATVPPLALVGDRVIVHITAGGGAGASPGGERSGQALVALDATTGEPRWSLDDRYPQSQLVLTAGDLALVEATASGERLVLDAGTGREVASFGSQAASCTSDRRTVIACTVTGLEGEGEGLGGGAGASAVQVATFDVEDREAAVSAPVPVPDLVLVGAHDGYLFAARPDGTKLVLDRAGNVLAEGASGTLIAMSDRYAVFAETEGAGQFFPSGTQPYAIFRVE